MSSSQKEPLLPDEILGQVGPQLRHHFEAESPTSMSAAMADAIKRMVEKGAPKQPRK